MIRPVVVLVEEPSARIVVEHLSERLGIAAQTHVLEHDGKSDLETSIPRKLGHWRAAMPPRFIVSRDSDSSRRGLIRARIAALIPDTALARTKIRIVVPELEAWYLGDPDALLAAGIIDTPRAESLRK